MTVPDPRRTSQVVEVLRKRGSVMWPSSQIPADFDAWRRDVRRAAREADLRISVRRVNDVVFIEHVDHIVTDDDMVATMRVMNDPSFGTDQALRFEDALHAVRRERLRVVRDDSGTDTGRRPDSTG